MCGKAITGFATGSWTAPEPRARESRPPQLYSGKGPTEGTEFGGWAFREAKG
jgi:hypothetical protein